MTQKIYYIITDNNNRIASSIYINKHSQPKQWRYVSFLTPSVFMPLSIAEREKAKLDQLAAQAGFDLAFTIKQVDIKDYLSTAGLSLGDCKVNTVPIPYGSFKKTWDAYVAVVPKSERSERL